MARPEAAGDPWAVLGVARSATYEEARRAYLTRSRVLHPDHHQDAGPDVLAEAGRAMGQLNDAWEALRVHFAAAPPGMRGPEHLVMPDVDLSPEQCLEWVLQRLCEAARAEGDPVLPDELELLRRPTASAPGGRRTARWLARRRRTLQAAVAADARDGDRATWDRAIRVIAEAGPRVMLLRLLQE